MYPNFQFKIQVTILQSFILSIIFQVFLLCRCDEKITSYGTVGKLYVFPILSADMAVGIFFHSSECSSGVSDQTSEFGQKGDFFKGKLKSSKFI